MIGLAMLAMIKAGATPPVAGDPHWFSIWAPVPRPAARRRPGDYDYSTRYYEIIDRITRGERP